MKTTAAIYHDEDKLADAVETLLGQSVPVDEISVVIRGRDGEVKREVPVEDETGAKRGAAIGAAVGATLGAVGVTLASVGTAMVAAGPLLAAVQGAAAGGVAGIPIGGVLGLGHWGGVHIGEGELEEGSALVAVHSDDLASLARGVFESTGADHITSE
jgi:hypothetical protein